MGHTRITHSHILTKVPPTRYEPYNNILTINDIVAECTTYEHSSRTQFYVPTNIRAALANNRETIENLLNYLHEVDPFN